MKNWFRKQAPIDIDDLIKPPRVLFTGFDGDTAKLKPQGVKRSDVILRARAELGVGMPPPRFLDRFTKRIRTNRVTYPAANAILQREAAIRAWPPPGPNDIHDERKVSR